MNKVIGPLKHVVETIWLLVSLASLGIAIRETYIHGLAPALKFYLFFAIGLFFFISRRNQRQKEMNL